MTKNRPFFDTNILVYAATDSGPKCAIADALLKVGGDISVQVLNEFVEVQRRKLKVDWQVIEERLCAIHTLFPSPFSLSLDTHRRAIVHARSLRMPLYDALIVASAQEAGCACVYSEDMSHGQRIGDMTIVNPFV